MAKCRTCGCAEGGFSVCSDPWHLLQAGYTMKDGVVTPPAAPVGEPAAMPPEMPQVKPGDLIVWQNGDIHKSNNSQANAINNEPGAWRIVAIYRDPLWRRTDRKEPTT